jgi:hypothetical protein
VCPHCRQEVTEVTRESILEMIGDGVPVEGDHRSAGGNHPKQVETPDTDGARRGHCAERGQDSSALRWFAVVRHVGTVGVYFPAAVSAFAENVHSFSEGGFVFYQNTVRPVFADPCRR